MGFMRDKMMTVIIILTVLQPHLGTEAADDWFGAYGEMRDGMEEGVSGAPEEAGIPEEVVAGEGIC